MTPLLITLLLTQMQSPQAASWALLERGLEYREIRVLSPESRSGGSLHVFRIDLQTHRLKAIDARSATRARAHVRALARERKAKLVVNGTYFDERERPLGLLIDEGRTLNPLRRADWGVFFVKDRTPKLIHTREWRDAPISGVELAIQVGPRCVIKGQEVKLKPQSARRAALGIQGDSKVLIVLSTQEVLSSDLAKTMASPQAQGGLECTDAVMLDGGGSAQLWAATKKREWNLPGAWPVPNGLAVETR